MANVKKCFFCGSRRLRPLAATTRKNGCLHTSQECCANCGLVVAQPKLSKDDIASYYRQHFYQQQWPDAQGTWAANIKNYQRQEVPLIEKLCLPWWNSGSSRILEIGCGYGSLLSILRNKGYSVYGFDISSVATAFCGSKGLSVVEASSENIPFKPAAFDVVISMCVIEHMNDPRAFVKQMLALVRPGGFIVLITDDAASSQYAWHRFTALISGRNVPLCSSSDHTFVFKENHIRAFLEEAGFRDIRLHKFNFVPERESFHWRMYKNLFRLLDRVTGRGEFIIAMGRRV